ncbi:MAG: tol-pal system protein YbgF [Lentisphaerae bacterium ADurb.BinA184]|nr:MAG: tol-pal system protein YbgF [Lentisphaerae bacterium ADurb.BinA184]
MNAWRQAVRSMPAVALVVIASLAPISGVFAAPAPPRADAAEVLVYPTREDGSIMDWLAISRLPWNAAYIGDSNSYDLFKRDGQSELTLRPRQGDRVQGQVWHTMHFNGTTEGPTMCNLFAVAGQGFDYAATVCVAYLYSPQERPGAVFAGSSDDALKIILNGKRIWANQIQRSPTYDSDQCPAPLLKGWNTLVCVVDQVWGGHLLCARFLDGGNGITDLEIALDPPAPDAVRHPAAEYNRLAGEQMRAADALSVAGKLAEAVSAYEQILAKYPLADVAVRAAYARATALCHPDGAPSLKQPEKAVEALNGLVERYGQDLLAEYAMLDLARLRETALGDADAAAETYRAFEARYPRSSLAAKAAVETARLLAAKGRHEDAMLTCRTVIRKYPDSDEVMTATVRIADIYRLAGDKDKARQQYEAARRMAQDWHDNKYGVDVGKQAWLEGILEDVRKQLGGL